jgi:hypothetical protein
MLGDHPFPPMSVLLPHRVRSDDRGALVDRLGCGPDGR